MRGATRRRPYWSCRNSYFNPRTPCGVRLNIRMTMLFHKHNFNPRTPCGVRQTLVQRLLRFGYISIHAPHAGCDSVSGCNDTASAAFQSTHPMRGATSPYHMTICPPAYFNPRTPCGVRPAGCSVAGVHAAISIHAPHAGCDAGSDVHRIGGQAISIHAPHAGCDYCARS